MLTPRILVYPLLLSGHNASKGGFPLGKFFRANRIFANVSMRGVMFSNFAAKKFDSQNVDLGPTLSLRLFIRFARKISPSGNQA